MTLLGLSNDCNGSRAPPTTRVVFWWEIREDSRNPGVNCVECVHVVMWLVVNPGLYGEMEGGWFLLGGSQRAGVDTGKSIGRAAKSVPDEHLGQTVGVLILAAHADQSDRAFDVDCVT